MLALAAIAILAVAVGGLVLFAVSTTRRAQAAVPPLGDFIELGGSRIHFVDVGPDVGQEKRDGSGAIVMIHGLGGTMRSFTYALVDDLADRFRVVALDRPGSGYSTRSDDRASVTDQAAQVARFIELKGLHRPLVVGHSLGGAIALALALNHPQTVGGLALLAPLTHHQPTIPAPFRWLAIQSRWLRWLIAWTLAVPIGIRNRHSMLALIFGPDAVPADFATRGGGLLGIRPRSFYATSTDLMAVGADLASLADRYGQLTLPLGILFGSADRILDPKLQAGAMAHKVAALQLEFIEGGGHMTPITAPQRTAEFIRRMAARIA